MNDKIKEARLLFQRKGIMKRDFIRNEVALSWARSQVFNLNSETLEKIPTNTATEIKYSPSKNYPYVDAILIFNVENQLIKFFERDSKSQFTKISYDENKLGTNGIALSKKTNRPFYISGYEHYNQYFFNKISFGYPTRYDDQDILVGFILSLTTKDFLNNQADLEEFAEEILDKIRFDTDSKSASASYTIDDYFSGKSHAMMTFKSKLLQQQNLSHPIFLSGPKGSGKEITARLIHDNSSLRDEKFYSLYCDKIPSSIIIEDLTRLQKQVANENQEGSYGTLYIEGIEHLTYKTQELLTRLLESKPVNSKLDKASFNNNYRVILSSEMSIEKLNEQKIIHPKLYSRINLFTINIPSLKEIKEDIPIIISKLIQKHSDQFLIDSVLFSNDLMNHLIRYEWPENFRELDKVIERIIYKGRSEKIIDLTYIPPNMMGSEQKDREIIPLEITEKKEIIQALEVMNFNIALTARALGIGRSTLYRKLDKYHIEI